MSKFYLTKPYRFETTLIFRTGSGEAVGKVEERGNRKVVVVETDDPVMARSLRLIHQFKNEIRSVKSPPTPTKQIKEVIKNAKQDDKKTE